MRYALTMMFAATVLSCGSAELSACGDKFLRIGRSMRYGRYAAAYPASILVYSPRASVPARVTDLVATLKRAGHTPVVVTQASDMRTALAGGRVDLVVMGLAQSDEVMRALADLPSRPDLVPVIFEGSAADDAAAASISSCRIRLPGRHRNDALAEIDHKMELRQSAARGK